jgi:hypothetical protein
LDGGRLSETTQDYLYDLAENNGEVSATDALRHLGEALIEDLLCIVGLD